MNHIIKPDTYIVDIHYDKAYNVFYGTVKSTESKSWFSIDPSGRVDISAPGNKNVHIYTVIDKRCIEHTFDRYFGNVTLVWHVTAMDHFKVLDQKVYKVVS